MQLFGRMSSRLSLCTIAIISVFLLSRAASAGDSVDGDVRNELSVFTRTTVPAPSGEFAAAYARHFGGGPFILEGSIGYGLPGIEVSIMPKLATGSRSNTLTFGLGGLLSLPIVAPPHQFVGVWVIPEIGYEHRFGGGVTLAMAVGYLVGIGHQMSPPCATGINCSSPYDARMQPAPELRIGIGRAF